MTYYFGNRTLQSDIMQFTFFSERWQALCILDLIKVWEMAFINNNIEIYYLFAHATLQ